MSLSLEKPGLMHVPIVAEASLWETRLDACAFSSRGQSLGKPGFMHVSLVAEVSLRENQA